MESSAKRTKPIPGGESETQYRQVTRKIVEGLSRDNLDTILFLCKDYIPPGRDIKTTLQLMKYLEDRDLVSQHSAVFLAEALHVIRRMDLLKIIPCIRNKKHFEDEFLALTYSSFTPYRVLTVQLQDELSQRDFEIFRDECSQHLNIRSIDGATNVLSLLRNLEEEDVISGDDFEELIKILENIDNVKPLKMFRRLIEGDESVVLPPAKQQQHRQNSEQDMFPDRRSTPAPLPQNPPSYQFVERVEAYPYNPLEVTQVSGGQRWPTAQPVDKRKPIAQHNLPYHYDFANPRAPSMSHSVDSRWFPGDEVTPKRLASSSAQYDTCRMTPYQSMPPQYPYDSPTWHRNHSVDDFMSMPSRISSPDSPPHYEEDPYRPQSLYHTTSYPQMRPLMMQYGRMAPGNPTGFVHDLPSSSNIRPLSGSFPARQVTPRPAFQSERPEQPPSDTLTPLREGVEALGLSAEKDGIKSEFIEAVEDEVRNEACVTTEAKPADAKPVIPDPEQEKVMEDLKRRNEELEKILEEQKNVGAYRMDSSPVGLCILINNMDFVRHRKYEEYQRRKRINDEKGESEKKSNLPRIDLEDREGSDKDADKLEKLFKSFDFEVMRYLNLEQRSMQKTLEEIAAIDHSEYDCFLLVILSHGANGCVFGVDGFSVSIESMQRKFVADNCASLANKPKIFIIQACQGAKPMPSYSPEADVISHDGPLPNDSVDNGTPNKADFLLAYATVPGYISYRSRLEGSYFVQEIVRIFKRYYETQDLLSMMIMVNDEVGKYQNKQVPLPIPTLRKKVFFRLKPGCSLDDLDDSRITEYVGQGSGMEVEFSDVQERRVTQESGEHSD